MNELKRLRDKIGLSNIGLADLLGLSEKTIVNRLSQSYKKKVASKLEIEFLQLLAGEHDKYIINKKQIK